MSSQPAGSYTRTDRPQVRQDMEMVFDHFPPLKQRRRHTAGYLSGGEQQMLAIGWALIARHKLIMLDEPYLCLAPLLVREISEIIKRINQEQHTTILSLTEVGTRKSYRGVKHYKWHKRWLS